MQVDDLWNRGERIVPGYTNCQGDEPMHRARYHFAKQYCHRFEDTIVDWGCGVGYGSEILRAAHYTGIDCSAEAIAYARNQYAAYGDFMVSHIETSEARGTFGIAFEVLEHLQAPPQDSLNLLLERTPRLLISVPYREAPGRNPWHCHAELSEETFAGHPNLVSVWYQSMSGEIIPTRTPAACIMLAYFLRGIPGTSNRSEGLC
jgi:SAM-dependent methyltransferase